MKYNWYPSNFQHFSFCERSFVSTVWNRKIYLLLVTWKKPHCYSFLIQTIFSGVYRAHLFLFPPWFKETHPQVFLKSFKLLVHFENIFPSSFLSPSDPFKEKFFRLPTAVPHRHYRVSSCLSLHFLLAGISVSPFSLTSWKRGALLATDLLILTTHLKHGICHVSLPLARG